MKGGRGNALCNTEFSKKLENTQEKTESDDDDDDLKPLFMILKPAEKAKFPATAKGYTRQAEKAQSNTFKKKYK